MFETNEGPWLEMQLSNLSKLVPQVSQEENNNRE